MAGALVWWGVHALGSHSFDWGLLVASFTRLKWNWVLLSFLPILASYYGRALRWAVFLKPLKKRPSIRNLLSATVIGFTAITLFGRAGELVRPYLIARKEQVPLSSQLATLLLERIFDLLMALLLFGFALAQVNASGVAVGPRLSSILSVGGKLVGVVAVLLLIILLAFRHLAEPARRRVTDALRFLPERHFRRAEKLVGAFVQGVESTRSDTAVIGMVAYSFLEWGLVIACYWCLAESFSGLHLTIVDVLIFLGFVSFGAAIQLPGIGGGIQVASVLVLTELFGTRLEVATSFALLVWIMTFVAIVPFGLVLALREGLEWHSLRQVGREVSM